MIEKPGDIIHIERVPHRVVESRVVTVVPTKGDPFAYTQVIVEPVHRARGER